MNERILKLAINCATHKDWDNPAVDPTEYTFSPSDVEKFAKSIVRECADIASEIGTNTEPTDFALDKCYEIESKIKEHFGVEE